MSMKETGETTPREIDRHEAGVGWIAYPEEGMQRASHALVVDGGVWVFDPVDAPGVDDILASLDAPVAGVVVCLDRHNRDAVRIARRHDVPIYAPSWMAGVENRGVELQSFDEEVTPGLRAIELRNSRIWQEVALYHEASGTLYVPESLGTVEYMLARGERLGIHPFVRLTPPTELAALTPGRIVVGHGEGVTSDTAAALDATLSEGRRKSLSAFANVVRSMVG